MVMPNIARFNTMIVRVCVSKKVGKDVDVQTHASGVALKGPRRNYGPRSAM